MRKGRRDARRFPMDPIGIAVGTALLVLIFKEQIEDWMRRHFKK
jgi:hypothetical protein